MSNVHEAALICAEAAAAKKANDIQVLDLQGLTTIADFFVICSGGSSTQVDAIADAVSRALAEAGMRPSHIEGGQGASWVLIDAGDVVVHVFDEQARTYYGLERLWGDAPRVPVAHQAAAAR